jgi:hypothetical protein
MCGSFLAIEAQAMGQWILRLRSEPMLAECDVTRTDMNDTGTVFLDPDQKSLHVQDFEAAEMRYGDANAVVKIDCAEFQHSHEIAKLSLLLFDEIEKASDSLWQRVLGILDKATLTLSDKESD